MNSRERMHAAMQFTSAPPDRVPVMCQLALGHYFLNTNIPAALVEEHAIHWKEGATPIVPPDDNPLVQLPVAGSRFPGATSATGNRQPATIHIEPHDRPGVVEIDKFPPWAYVPLHGTHTWACSVPPRAPAENILAIVRAARESACVA